MRASKLDWYQRIVSRLNKANSEDDLKESTVSVLSEALSILGYSSGGIKLFSSSEKANLSVEAIQGGARFCFPGASAPDCACGKALRSGRDEEPVFENVTRKECEEAGFEKALVSPINIKDRPGGLFMAVGGAGASDADDELEMVSDILKTLGGSAERILDNKSLEGRASDLETVNTVGRLITSKLTLKDMVCEIVARLGAVMETDEVNVVVYDDERKELSFLASYFADGSNLERPEVYPLSDGMNSWIVKNRKPLLMKRDTVEECSRLGIRHGGRPAKSWLGAPMLYQDKVVGVLSVQSYAKTGLYGERETELLNAVARQCAVAVENARLFEEVVEREREKELLYFSLTHDLLSFLSPVSGYAKLLKSLPEGTDPKNISGIVESIISSTDRISRFVEDILVYAKIKSGKLTLNIERADVMRVLEFAVHTHMPELAMRRVGVKINGKKMAPDNVAVDGKLDADFDRAQLERVMLNLLGNAVKHARSMISIDARVEGPFVRVRVSDDGPGASDDQLDTLFDEFYQSGAKKKGVGLGLPTAKKIVNLHQGNIHAESVPGGGFGIEFSWPRTLAEREEAKRRGGAVEA